MGQCQERKKKQRLVVLRKHSKNARSEPRFVAQTASMMTMMIVKMMMMMVMVKVMMWKKCQRRKEQEKKELGHEPKSEVQEVFQE